MVWVAVVILVCMAAMGIALLGLVGYLLYLLARRLAEGGAALVRLGLLRLGILRLDGTEPEPVGEPPKPIAHS